MCFSVCLHLYVSDGEHVFMRSCAPVQLVILAQHVAPRNSADVQMFLLGKQTQQRPFSPGQRDCQNKSLSSPLDLSSNSDSLIHKQITTCPFFAGCFWGFFLPAFGYIVSFVLILFSCMFVHVSGASISLMGHKGGERFQILKTLGRN